MSSSWTFEYQSPVAAPRLFKAVILDWHTLGPKLVPEVVASAAPVEGDGGAGSVRQLNFTSAMPFSYVKERLDSVDEAKLECKQTLIEGGDLGKKLESASSHFKFEPAGNGCVVKVTTHYKALPGCDNPEDIAKAKEALTGMFKSAEGYLQANPTAYA